MPLLNYTTKVDAHTSVGEIVGMLVKHGATKIMHDYEGGNIKAVSFMLETPLGPRGFRLPGNAGKVQAVLVRQKVEPRYREYEHAERVAWRILKDWVEAQLALLQSEQVTLDQLFLPHMVNDEGRTLYELYASNALLLEA